MDPLSVGASVIAIASLAASVSSAFVKLRALCHELPGRLYALNNEVTDLECVLGQLVLLVQTRQIHLADHHCEILPVALERAEEKLEELRCLVQRLILACHNSKTKIAAAAAWRRLHPKLQLLQDDLKDIKSSINLIIGACNSHDMMQVRLEIAAISSCTSKAYSEQELLRADIASSMHTVDDRIAKIEAMLQWQTQRIQTNQFEQVGSLYNDPHPPPSYRRTPSPSPTRRKSVDQQDLTVRVTPYTIKCRPDCVCVCHARQTSSSPAILSRMLGQLFVGYAGIPSLSQKCDVSDCRRSTASHSNLGTIFHLETLRRVPDSAQCVTFALNGDIDGLKYLFKNGLASPRDVSSTRGYSVLRWALYGKQYKTCEFLIQAGADPDYRPIAASDNNPRNKACHFLLEGSLSRDGENALQAITRGGHFDDFVDHSNFTQLHRIVLGLSLADLEEHLMLCPEDIDIPDAMGRTPLAWAAARGDQRACVLLLSHGADANAIDSQLSGPVSNAASQGHTVCVRLLLEAGADPDPPRPAGVKKGSPLNCAARNSNDVALLKTLLDFGADVDACGEDGITGLIHAARRDHSSFAMLLLDSGANINATSTSGSTPLTTAITYNSHNVLRLILDRWHEYSSCPRLTGPHLLHLVAQYADLETMRILISTDHFKIKYDERYAKEDAYRDLLSGRPDHVNDLVESFTDLLSIINHIPTPGLDKNQILEAGLSHTNARLEKKTMNGWFSCLGRDEGGKTAFCTVSSKPDSDDGSEKSFEDAREEFEQQAITVQYTDEKGAHCQLI